MDRTLDLAFIFGAGFVLLKAADLLLRPHQQKWLQNKLETLTLWFSEQNPLRWFTYLSKPTVFWTITFFIGAPLAYELGKPLFAITSQTDVLVFLALVVLSLPNFPKASDLAKHTVEYLAGRLEPTENYGFLEYLYRFILTILRFAFLCALLAGVAYVGFKIFLVVMKGHSWGFEPDLARLAFIPVWPFLFFLYTIVFAGLLIIFGWSLLLLCQIIVFVVRSVLWRMVEFNKGAFGAIIVIVTAILGIIDLIVKLKH
jgi:hypothetical protein